MMRKLISICQFEVTNWILEKFTQSIYSIISFVVFCVAKNKEKRKLQEWMIEKNNASHKIIVKCWVFPI